MSDAVTLAPKLDLAAASELMTTLRGRTDEELVLDMSDVKHFGALCLQVIISAATTANSQNRKIIFSNVSDRVLEQMRVMGMTPESIVKGRQ